jgi:SET domain-containing protein
MRIFPPTKIYVSKSDIHGYGVFASTFILEGEVIEECPIFDLNIPKGEPSEVLIDYRFNWPQGTEFWDKQVIAWGWGSLYNHSNTPCASWRSNIQNQTFEFFALRDIKPNEEILVYYGGDGYWLDGRAHTEVK